MQNVHTTTVQQPEPEMIPFHRQKTPQYSEPAENKHSPKTDKVKTIPRFPTLERQTAFPYQENRFLNTSLLQAMEEGLANQEERLSIKSLIMMYRDDAIRAVGSFIDHNTTSHEPPIGTKQDN